MGLGRRRKGGGLPGAVSPAPPRRFDLAPQRAGRRPARMFAGGGGKAGKRRVCLRSAPTGRIPPHRRLDSAADAAPRQHDRRRAPAQAPPIRPPPRATGFTSPRHAAPASQSVPVRRRSSVVVAIMLTPRSHAQIAQRLEPCGTRHATAGFRVDKRTITPHTSRYWLRLAYGRH